VQGSLLLTFAKRATDVMQNAIDVANRGGRHEIAACSNELVLHCR